jgi:hypothetical protein
MLSRLSHPLAFATAPLDGTAPEYGGESFFVVGDEGANGMGDTIVPITRSMAGTMLDHTSPAARERQDMMTARNRQDPAMERQINGMGRGKTLEEYAVENQQLKLAVDQLSRKLASYKEVPPSLLILTVDCKIILLPP